MDWINMSWHLGAVGAGLWAAWLIHDLRTERSELLEAVLPCSLGFAGTISKGRFLRASRCIMRLGMSSVLVGKIEIRLSESLSAKSPNYTAEHARQALAQIHALGWYLNRNQGEMMPSQDKIFFLLEQKGGQESENIPVKDFMARLLDSKAASFIFEYLGPTYLGRDTVYWSVKEV